MFNAYQQGQGESVAAAMRRAQYIASFIGHEAGRALFVGLYQVGEHRRLTADQFWAIPENLELKTFGMRAALFDIPGVTVQWSDLAPTPYLSGWKGKLVITWPPPERSWWRWASGKSNFEVHAIHEESVLTPSRPPWREINLAWSQLSLLPASWRNALSEWRGIYLIFDTSDAKSYVGSAYSAENLLGRWLNYGASGHGGNKLLKQRDAVNFQFTILERVSPDMPSEDVIRLESSWKDRLHTRHPYGLNEN